MADTETIYVVGQYRSGEWPLVAWDLQGVFVNWADAISACRNKRYFVATVPLGVSLPDEPIVLPVVYPHIQDGVLFGVLDARRA